MSTLTLINEGFELFEEKKYQEAIEKLNEALDSIQDKSQQIGEQNNAQFWLGRCYLEQALKTHNEAEAKPLFEQAITHHNEQLALAETIGDEQKQHNAQGWLGRCYLEQAIKTQNETETKLLFEQAITHSKEELALAEKLKDEQKQHNAKAVLAVCYINANISDDKSKGFLDTYFDMKKTSIYNRIFQNKAENYYQDICSILSVLSIFPYEIVKTRYAHYTTANVAELLFGLNKKKKEERTDENERDKSNMRMNSATYMNDPYEGKSLLEFLGKPEESLENIMEFPEYNAFFSCFSSRVNDLNQFRLYGKEDGVEASGCCLVFNKNSDWLKGSDITKSFSSIKEQEETTISIQSEKKYSLYQIAYLAYLDEYIDTAKYKDEMIKEDNSKFAIYLPKIGNNDEWHKLRMEKLKEALENLKDEINKEDTKFDQQALEYIRYLFKDFAFKDEEEFRMLTLKKLGDDTKYCEKTNSVFMEYGDISNMVDEVILGTNYEKTTKNRKVEVFRHKMIDSGFKNVKVTQSSLPINANPPMPEKKNQ